MSILGFDDGSYIELISVVKPGQPSPSWGKQVAGNGGPCAWAVEAQDLAREVARTKKMGIKTIGPDDYNRKRPDGVLVEWQLAFIGDEEPGATLPFLIKDKTPRSYRVVPSPSVVSTDLIGVGRVILGVKDLKRTVAMFRKVYDWDEPVKSNIVGGIFENTELAEFQDSPVVVASPTAKESWLTKRLEQFGDCPCSFLIGTKSLREATTRYGLTQPRKWIASDETVAWIPSSKLGGINLGFIEV